MAKQLIITIEFDDDSDFDFWRQNMVGAIEDEIESILEEGRNDGDITVTWDTADVNGE